MSLVEPYLRPAYISSRSPQPRLLYPAFMAHATPPIDCLTVKSGSAWTDAELNLCNVNVVDVDVSTFFGIWARDLPAPSVSPAILNTKAAYPRKPHPLHTQTALTNEERMFFKYLEEAMEPGENQTSAIADFTVHVLQLLGFTETKPSKQHPKESGQYRRVLRKDHDLPLFMCGRTVHTTADTCLLFPSTEAHLGDTVLLLGKAAPLLPSGDVSSAEAQLLAQAIGAFQCYNRDRRRARLAPVDKQIFLGLIMRGTTPILYKLEISVDLVECVQSSQKPPRATKVLRLSLPLEHPETVEMEGMIPVGNRRILLGCLEALKGMI
ncbi:hypothetical protein H0H87_009625 [Tephrocybe sp. NHM501043]|nr:hypothetical protein H0H87_009625 [Tephrocybe sp. NHM501043]